MRLLLDTCTFFWTRHKGQITKRTQFAGAAEKAKLRNEPISQARRGGKMASARSRGGSEGRGTRARGEGVIHAVNGYLMKS